MTRYVGQRPTEQTAPPAASVEIPEAAVEAARSAHTKAWRDALKGTPAKPMSAALEAALPYLVPAEPPTLDLEEVLLILAQFDVGGWKYDNPQEFRDRLGAALVKLRAPAGDGGLREALGEAWDDGNAVGLDGYIGPGRGAGEVDPEAVAARERIVDKLAAHPAAPAVPQPADREALAKVLATSRAQRDGNPGMAWNYLQDAREDASALLALLGQEEKP